MSLAVGAKVKQTIKPDKHHFRWDESQTRRLHVQIVGSEMFRKITEEDPPASTISAKTYSACGAEYYDAWDERNGVSGAFSSVKPIGELENEFHADDA